MVTGRLGVFFETKKGVKIKDAVGGLCIALPLAREPAAWDRLGMQVTEVNQVVPVALNKITAGVGIAKGFAWHRVRSAFAKPCMAIPGACVGNQG